MKTHAWSLRRRGLTLGLLCAIAMGLAFLPQPSRAATFTVDTLLDEDDGVDVGSVSLRDAITAANSNSEADTITFSVTGTIILGSILPKVATDMTILGPGAAELVVSGDSACAILFSSAADLTVTDLTLANGLARGGDGAPNGVAGGGGAAGMGGALYVDSGSVWMENVAFRYNEAAGGNGSSATISPEQFSAGGGGVGGDGSGYDGGPGGEFGGLPGGYDGTGGGKGAGGGGSEWRSGGWGGWGGGGGGGGWDWAAVVNGGAGGFGGGGGGGGWQNAPNSPGAGGAGGSFAGDGGDGEIGMRGRAGGGGGGAGLGGAIFLGAGSLTLLDCSFHGNSAVRGVGGQHGPNGGEDGQPGLGKGGAIFAAAGASIFVSGTVFSNSIASDAAGALGDTNTVYGAFVKALDVASISLASPSPTSATSIEYTVRFSENVTGVDETDFVLIKDGTATGNVSASTAVTDLAYAVTVSGVAGDGTLRLDLASDGSITTLVGDALADTVYFIGEECVVDTPPEVLSIARATGSPTTATSVGYVVTFDESVSGVDASDFTVTTTHGAAANVAAVTPATGEIFTVTVDGYPQDCNLRLDLRDNDSIRDLADNPLGGQGVGNGDMEGEGYVIDDPAPYVVSIVRADPNPTNADTVEFEVTFNENVLNVGSDDFSLGVTGTVVHDPLPEPTGGGMAWFVEMTGVGGDGTLGLNVIDNGSITDSGGGELLGGDGLGNGDFTDGEIYEIDNTAPHVVSVACEGASPTEAKAVIFTVAFSEEVTGVDAGDFVADATFTGTWTVTGVDPATASDVYTVTVSNVSGEGALHLEVGTGISDLAGNPLQVAYTSSESFDPPPYVDSITEGDGPTADPVTFTVTFSEGVAGVDDDLNFSVAKTHTADCDGTFTVSIGGSVSEYTVELNGITGSGTLRLDVVDGDFISDASGAPLGGADAGNGDYAGGLPHVVGATVPPHVTAIERVDPNPTNRPTVRFTVTFYSNVTLPAQNSAFVLTSTGTAQGRLASVTPTETPTSTCEVEVDMVRGNGTLRLDVVDDNSIAGLGGAGLDNGNFAAGEVYDVDFEPPRVVSVVPSGMPPGATSVVFAVTFSEAVTGVDVKDFVTVSGSPVPGTVSSVAPVTPSIYAVTVAGLTTTGSMRLDVVDDDSIMDAATNPLGGGLTGNGDYVDGVVKSYSITPKDLGLAGGGGCSGAGTGATTAGSVVPLMLVALACLARHRRRTVA